MRSKLFVASEVNKLNDEVVEFTLEKQNRFTRARSGCIYRLRFCTSRFTDVLALNRNDNKLSAE